MLPAARWFPLLCLCLGCAAQESDRGLPPVSPCPAVYGYGWDPAGGWQGIITILPPARFSEAQLVLRMTVPYYRPQAGVGRVEIKGGQAEVQAISNRAFRGERHQIQYVIIFPPFDSLPRIKEIFINGKNFCAAKQEYPDTKSTIELKYVLKTGLNLPVASGNEFSIVRKNPTRPDNEEEVIYVIQGQEGSYIIPGGQLTTSKPTTPTPPPSPPPPEPQTPFNRPSVSEEPSTKPATDPTSTEDQDPDYWDIFSSPGPGSTSHKPGAVKPPRPKPDQPATTPKPKPPATTRRPRPKPKPKPTTAPAYEDTSIGSSNEVEVNGLNCGVQTIRPNFLVVNGVTAEKGQWPWQVALFKSSSTGLTFQCGGTLISKKHVITAGHCVYIRAKQKPVTPDTVLVYLGKHNLRSWTEEGQQAKDVDKIIIHPNYGKKNHDFDVAIIVLATLADYSEYVHPVCLWDKSPNLNTIINKHGTVVGWGRDEDGDIAHELKMAKMPVVSQETCLRSDTFYSVFTSDATYCAGFRNGTSVCNGDSGGGMFFYLDNPKQHTKTWYTRGVVSISRLQASEQLCDDKSYVVFTDLAKMLPWLRQQIAAPTS